MLIFFQNKLLYKSEFFSQNKLLKNITNKIMSLLLLEINTEGYLVMFVID